MDYKIHWKKKMYFTYYIIFWDLADFSCFRVYCIIVNIKNHIFHFSVLLFSTKKVRDKKNYSIYHFDIFCYVSYIYIYIYFE